MNNIAKAFQNFREKFGFVIYDQILLIFSRLYEQARSLEKSRDLWKNKYMKIKEELKNEKWKLKNEK